MKAKKLITILLVVAIILGLVGCGGESIVNPLIGMWEGDPGWIEFHIDGMYESRNWLRSGTFNILEDGRIRFEGNDGNTYTYDWELDENVLTISANCGTRWTRREELDRPT